MPTKTGKQTKSEMNTEFEALKQAYATLIEENERIKAALETLILEQDSVHKLKDDLMTQQEELAQKLSDAYWSPKKNERGAGRKPILNTKEVTRVHTLRATGMTQQAIANEMDISQALINKILNTSKND